MKRHHIVAVFVLSLRRIIRLYTIPPWGYRPCNSDGHHLYPTRNCRIFLRKIAIMAQTCGSHGALNFLRVNGGSCGFHGGYSGSNFLMYHGDWRRSLPLL